MSLRLSSDYEALVAAQCNLRIIVKHVPLEWKTILPSISHTYIYIYIYNMCVGMCMCVYLHACTELHTYIHMLLTKNYSNQ